MNFTTYFTNTGVPETGLIPTVRIRDISNNTLIITDSTSSEVGDGWYKYDFTAYDSSKEYVIRFDGGVSLPDNDRYKFSTNNSFASDITTAVWKEDLSTYDEGAALQQHCQTYDNYITIDSINGSSGTAYPVGTHCNPVDNLTDALIIADKYSIDRILLHTSLTVEASHDISGMAIETHGVMGTTVTLDINCITNNSVFRYLNLQGIVNNGDILLVENCSILNLENFTGIMQGVSLAQGCELSIGTWAEIYNCRAGGESGNEPEISIGTADLNIQQYRGNLKLTNKTGSNRIVAGFLAGNVIITDTCVAGKIQILGIGQVEKDESAAECKVDIDAAITNEYIADHVLDELITEHNIEHSLGLSMQKTLGLLHQNIYMDNPSYDNANNLISCRIRIYSNSTDVGTDLSVLSTYTVTATTNNILGKFVTWSQIET